MATWRYMSFPKFVSFLLDGLYFSRVDCLGDSWEGALPSGTAGLFETTAKEAVARGNAAQLPFLRQMWSKIYVDARLRMFANCWQLAPADSWWMWKIYCESDYGVALRSTYDLLDRQVPLKYEYRNILIGLMQYGDYDSGGYVTDPANTFAAVMSKRDAFQDEREVRLVCDSVSPEKTRTGFFISVDPNQLLNSIVVSPLSPDWFRTIVEATARALKCTVSVEDSRLRREPTFSL